jgi:hypothetical protein
MIWRHRSSTFGDLMREHVEIEGTSGNRCHRRTIDAASSPAAQPRDRWRPVRREQCGSVGLPIIGKQHRWRGLIMRASCAE